MSKSFDVCIRGDGIVGRTLALLLARDRLRVALVAKPTASQPVVPDVRAYALNGASRQLLQSVRGWPAEPDSGSGWAQTAPSPALAQAIKGPLGPLAPVTPVVQMRVWGDDGGELDFKLPQRDAPTAAARHAGAKAALDDAATLAWIVDVPALEQALAQALRFQPQVERIASPDDASAALTIICEGQKSSSRHEFGARWVVKPYAQKALAARLYSDQPHRGVARQWFNHGDILALLPLGGADSNALALVWSVGTARAEALEKMTPHDFMAALQPACGAEAGRLSLASTVVSWPLALSHAERWVGAGWALAGDAAHTVHPLAGQGLNLGLADARQLAEVLHGREYWRALGDERLLRRYERARKADVAAMGAVTDGLQGLFAQTDVRWQALRNWGMKGVALNAPLKAWLTRQATGL